MKMFITYLRKLIFKISANSLQKWAKSALIRILHNPVTPRKLNSKENGNLAKKVLAKFAIVENSADQQMLFHCQKYFGSK